MGPVSVWYRGWARIQSARTVLVEGNKGPVTGVLMEGGQGTSQGGMC